MKFKKRLERELFEVNYPGYAGLAEDYPEDKGVQEFVANKKEELLPRLESPWVTKLKHYKNSVSKLLIGDAQSESDFKLISKLREQKKLLYGVLLMTSPMMFSSDSPMLLHKDKFQIVQLKQHEPDLPLER